MGYDEHLGRCSGLPVVRDLEATASGVRSATPKEALDSGRVHRDRGKVGDLTGASGAYVLGLLGYEVGAASMTVAQGLGAIIVSGGDRRDRRVAAAARDAVADPRQLRRRDAEEGSGALVGAAGPAGPASVIVTRPGLLLVSMMETV